MESHDRLKAAREAAGYKFASDASRALGMKESTYRSYENGNRNITIEIAPQFAKKFKTTSAYLLYGEKPQPEEVEFHPKPAGMTYYVQELDVTAHGGCGALDGAINEYSIGEWSFPQNFIRNKLDTSKSCLSMITVVGDSMEPEFPSGCKVMVDTNDKSPTPGGFFVVWDGNGLVMKRVEYIPHSNPAKVRISSTNAAYREYEVLLDEAHICGRVVFVGKWV